MPTPPSSSSSSTASSGASCATPDRLAIQGERPSEIAARTGCDLATARKLVAAVHKHGRDELSGSVPRQGTRAGVDAIAARYRVGRLEVVAREPSAIDPFVKYVLGCEDGARIEAVRIPLEKPGRFVACVSSQVGCALGCAYCATGRLGLVRNLEAWEIVEQVRIVRRDLPEGGRVHGVVFQGMGEPLANVERVVAAIRVLCDPCGGAIDQRAMTVCTAGLPAGIRELARAGVRVRLGVSITSARPEVRRSLVPIDRVHPLVEVLEATAAYALVTGDAPMLAVTTLSGVNTSDAEADALASMLLAFRERTGIAPRLSLVSYNPDGEHDPFSRAGDEEAEHFRRRLMAVGVPVVRRYSGGSDVGAACGQLVGRVRG